MKIIIAGGRDFIDLPLMRKEMAKYENLCTEVVSGLAKGADTLGKAWAKEKNIPVREFPANWDKHGKSAGYVRNKEMAEYGDIVVAFWDGSSKGTKHMIDLAKSNQLETHIVHYVGGEGISLTRDIEEAWDFFGL